MCTYAVRVTYLAAGFLFCLGQIACIFRLITVISGNDELEDASEILKRFTDAVFCTQDIQYAETCTKPALEIEPRLRFSEYMILFAFEPYNSLRYHGIIQAQHKIEMDRRDGKFGPPPVMIVPIVQQMSRINQPVPPAVGHLTQPGQWQPPYGHACPPSIPGYPAAAHTPPPPGYPAVACPLPAPGYFPAGCPPPTQNFPYSTPHPQGYPK
ncbi:hypothetical protein CRYUN_Cryun23aG0136300 [Craigia yunnanensis]